MKFEDITISLIGENEGSSAFMTIARQLGAAFERLGVQVAINDHLIDDKLTQIALTCQYPLRAPNVRHHFNAIYCAWEFWGEKATPQSFLRVFNQHDLVVGSSEWTKNQFQLAAPHLPMTFAHHGVDLKEFTRDGEHVDWQQFGFPRGVKVIMWVGGSDERHGLDIAAKIMDQLPSNYWLFAKLGKYYPNVPTPSHPRIIKTRQDFASLAPFYRSAFCFLHSSHGAGFAMPVQEAMACGTPVVSTRIPAIAEYAYSPLINFGGKQTIDVYPYHEAHNDCLLKWLVFDEEDIVDLAAKIIWLEGGKPFLHTDHDLWRSLNSWDRQAELLLERLAAQMQFKPYTRPGSYDDEVVKEIRWHYFPEMIDYREMRRVVDVGAHIGSFVSYVKEFCPDSTIWAIEMMEDNFSLLRKNAEKLPYPANIHCAWAKARFTRSLDAVSQIPGNRGSYRLAESDTFNGIDFVPVTKGVATGYFNLSSVFEIYQIDLLKLDCEGSEFDLIIGLRDRGLLDKCDRIVGEYHTFAGDFHQLVTTLPNFDIMYLETNPNWGRFYLRRKGVVDAK